ncbi:ACD10 dehydrogenase, partial [Nyctiprogne leucopyga]|nr:ACD10 dehydrogenase [Nyctiprogne leucopyga]
YKAVIFEASGVLLPSPYKAAADWEAQNCLPAGTIQRAVLSGGENSLSLKYTRGELTTVEFLQELGQQCFEIANACIPVDSFLSDLIRNEMIKQLPIMAEAVQCIRAEGLKTALLSNNFCLLNGDSSLPLDRKHFDVMVGSYQEGMHKPDHHIYKLCLERLGVQPQESIFLDSSSQNLKAAAQLGIQTVKVDDPEVALKELETYLGFPLQGFVPYTCSMRPSMEIPKDHLQKYLENVLGDHTTGPLVLRQFGHGQSTRTYCVRFGDRLLVLKKEPPDSLHPSGPAVKREYRVLKALSEAGVPVPTVLALCEDRSTRGEERRGEERRAGRVYSDVSLERRGEERRGEESAAMSQVLSKREERRGEERRGEDLGEHGNYIQQQVKREERRGEERRGEAIPAMERLIERGEERRGEERRATVVHGDFRMDKRGEERRGEERRAVLGWKLSTLERRGEERRGEERAYFLPPHFSLERRGEERRGEERAEEYSQMYCGEERRGEERRGEFYMAFAFFRL